MLQRRTAGSDRFRQLDGFRDLDPRRRATKNCAPAAGEMPFIEAATRILRIPEGKLLNDDGTTACFTAELQASEDYQHWTLLAGNYRDCR